MITFAVTRSTLPLLRYVYVGRFTVQLFSFAFVDCVVVVVGVAFCATVCGCTHVCVWLVAAVILRFFYVTALYSLILVYVYFTFTFAFTR